MTTVLQYLVIAAVIGLLLFGLALLLFGRGERLSALPARTSPARLPERDIRGADVREVRFALALRGYRMSDVDWTLERLADELDRTRQELALATGHGDDGDRFADRPTAGDDEDDLLAGGATVDQARGRSHEIIGHNSSLGRGPAGSDGTSTDHGDAVGESTDPYGPPRTHRSGVPAAVGAPDASASEYRVDPGWSTAPLPVEPASVTSAPDGSAVTGSSLGAPAPAADRGARSAPQPTAVADAAHGWADGAAAFDASTGAATTNGRSVHGAAASGAQVPDPADEPGRPGATAGDHASAGSHGSAGAHEPTFADGAPDHPQRRPDGSAS